MSDFSAKHPLVFGALVFVATIVATLPFMFVFQGVGQPVEVASALARIVVAAIVTG